MKRYYEILGVSRYAKTEEVQSAVNAKLKEFHPDRNPGNEYAEKMTKKILEAKEILLNPEKRRKYDRSLPEYYRPESVHIFDEIADDLFEDI